MNNEWGASPTSGDTMNMSRALQAQVEGACLCKWTRRSLDSSSKRVPKAYRETQHECYMAKLDCHQPLQTGRMPQK